MTKRNILLIALITSFVLLSIFGYLGLKDDPNFASPYQAMPENTSAVLTINDYSRTFKSLLQNNLMWQELMLDEGVSSLSQNMILLDSVISNNDWSAEFAEKIQWNITFHAVGDNFKYSIVIPCERENNEEFKEWFEYYSESISLYGNFEEIEISTCQFKEGLFGQYYFTLHKGLLIVSNEAYLVEDALRTLLNGKSLNDNKEFKKVQKTTGAFADWNFLVNYSDEKGLNLLGLNGSELEKSSLNWSGWTALDATVHPDLILLNGFSHATSNSYLSLFSKQKSQEVDAIEIIPEDVSMFIHFGLSNYKTYSKAKRAYFKSRGKDKAYQDKIETVKSEFQVDLENEFDQWISNEFGVMYIPLQGVKVSDAKVAFFRLSDIRRTLSVLEALSEDIESDHPEFKRLPVPSLFDDFESPLFNNIDKPYFIILDKYLLMSSHADLLSKIKEQYLQANTLKKSEMYARFSGNLSDQSNVYIYVHLESGYDVYEEILNEVSIDFLNRNESIAQKFEQIGIQFMDGKKNMFYQHMAMNYNARKRSQGNILWEAVLDTDLLMKPQVVYNHYNNSRELIVQDVANTVYLIDNKGNVAWKRQMKEAIISKVYQIDVYKNNKLQMLFSGESSIYLIDRKGRDVDNFPIQLPAVATNELKVIDYEKNREYRILIGVRGGEILNFDRFGKEIKGWKFNSNDEITYPINYFLLNGKDYILAAGAEGQPYVLNRRGDVRLKISEKLPPYSDKPYFLELSNDIDQCKFVTTDESGNFVKLKFNGEKEIINLDLFSAKHHVMYDDINNDRKNDYILLDSNRLMVYDHTKEKLFEIELEGNDPQYLNVYKFDGGYGKIGFTDVASAQVYLYRDAGGLDSNFPLKGNTPFTITDLNKDGRQNLIVGMNNRLIVYNLK